MATVPATEFKARCLELMDRVAQRKESFVITKRGRPVAQLVPVKPERVPDIFGCMRGKGEIVGDIVTPILRPEAWETVREWDEFMAEDRAKARRDKRAQKGRARRR